MLRIFFSPFILSEAGVCKWLFVRVINISHFILNLLVNHLCTVGFCESFNFVNGKPSSTQSVRLYRGGVRTSLSSGSLCIVYAWAAVKKCSPPPSFSPALDDIALWRDHRKRRPACNDVLRAWSYSTCLHHTTQRSLDASRIQQPIVSSTKGFTLPQQWTSPSGDTVPCTWQIKSAGDQLTSPSHNLYMAPWGIIVWYFVYTRPYYHLICFP